MAIQHLKTIKPERVLPHIGKKRTLLFKVKDREYRVRINTSKMKLFKSNMVCVECSREGILPAEPIV